MSTLDRFIKVCSDLSNLSIDWNVENFLTLTFTGNNGSNGNNSDIEMMFYACEEPDKMVTNLYNFGNGQGHGQGHAFGSMINSYTCKSHGSSLNLQLKAIGMVENVDFVYENQQAFVRMNDFAKIAELIVSFGRCNGHYSHESKSNDEIKMSIAGIHLLSCYNDCKKRNKENQIKRFGSKPEIDMTSKSEKGMIIIRSVKTEFIISKNIEDKLESVMEDLDEFSVSYFDKFTEIGDNSTVIVIESIGKKEILKAMKFYKSREISNS